VVEKIKEAKDDILAYLSKEISRYGGDKMDIAAIEKISDAVKDLAEAEKACWEAEYYRSTIEVTESAGYMPDGMGYQGGQQGGNQGGRMGYNPNRDSMGRYSRGRRGYHEGMDSIREELRNASPEEREKKKRELRQMLDM
jgi:hypothetical protein